MHLRNSCTYWLTHVRPKSIQRNSTCCQKVHQIWFIIFSCGYSRDSCCSVVIMLMMVVLFCFQLQCPWMNFGLLLNTKHYVSISLLSLSLSLFLSFFVSFLEILYLYCSAIDVATVKTVYYRMDVIDRKMVLAKVFSLQN